ncbi:hypothetical protein [Sporocytophaga myxococcoides]|uniref:hypothetical protein n=1 Tax=Sporocytophaga myxococcoides TaxID=153721 RepID=UPI00041F3852|nr:hypothetical protein [Sporocytophaga myxococcoides]
MTAFKIYIKYYLLYLLLIITPKLAFSQQTDQQKTEALQFLKDQKQITIKFDYSDLKIREFPEADFLEEKMEEKESRSEGAGERWLISWKQDKEQNFPRKFMILFNKYLAKKGLKTSDNATPYTLIVKTLKIDPGWISGTIVAQPAVTDFEFYFVKTDSPEVVLCKFRLSNVEGSADYDAGKRMQECYAKAGKQLAKYIAEYAFK